MKRILIKETLENLDKAVLLMGRVATIRDHGKLTFLDLVDESGIVQVVLREKGEILGEQDIIQIEGTVKKRPQELVNHDIETGEIEVDAMGVTVISKSLALPIPIEGDGYEISEDLRLKYRFLDLRRRRLQKNLRLRHKVVLAVRDFFDKEGFIEVETPYLSKTTPEGARDFLVPSRIHGGKFYALAQAPQQYKQLLMISGFEKYFQLARAFRDEDMRADRQFEHTQIDIEMAYVSREDILSLIERMMVKISEEIGKKITQKPFPVYKYKEAIKKFGKDKFDLRKSNESETLAFAWVVDFPLLEFDKGTKKYTFSHNPFTAPKEKDLENLKKGINLDSLESYQYDLVLNGEELGSGSVRITNPDVQVSVFKAMGMSNSKIERDFGHLLNAYKYAAPPHGGIAIGLDRLIAVLSSETSIREVIAFPVSGSGQTSVMDAPSEIDDEVLKETGIKNR